MSSDWMPTKDSAIQDQAEILKPVHFMGVSLNNETLLTYSVI